MSYFVDKYWLSDGGGVTRRDRQGCAYRAYVPDALSSRSFTFDGDVAADMADAEAAIRELNSEASALVSTEAIARILLRAEAVASSKLEGLQAGARRLLRVEAAREFEAGGRRDVTAEEVLGSVDAMAEALRAADSADRVSAETLQDIHAALLANTPLSEHAGRIREEQNWIGGSDYNPCSAAFVPPPPELVPELLEDLAAFCNDDLLPAVAQAAIAHAQFETIHPFADGNGRAGRALIHLILRRRGVAPRVVPPISLILATLSTDYISGLTAFRYHGEPASQSAIEGTNRWVGLFAGCCVRAVRDSGEYEARVHEIQETWRAELGSVRRNSAVDEMLRVLPGTPIVTVTSAARMLDRSFNAASRAMEQLQAAGIVRQITVGRRNRAFEAYEIIDAFADLERQLASPARDTRVEPPARPVPARRQGDGA
ncbi:MAG: Fic family protein [Actinomycetota bacterium]|nr:Fic family protein [Actinomycetota bacterium]MDZ4181048.1 Fic family protein [Coriobacteriia bacterium]